MKEWINEWIVIDHRNGHKPWPDDESSKKTAEVYTFIAAKNTTEKERNII